MASAARELEPDPLPDDLPNKAPVISDIERGYAKDSTRYDDIAAVGTTSGRQSGGEAGGGGDSSKREEKVKGKGLTEGDEDMDEIPENNFWLVMPSIGLMLFLAALDMTIVATALPEISEELNASPSEYSWVGTSYTLAMTLLAPVNGRVSDIVGRKPLLYIAIVDFVIFSALCGAAKSMTWLIVCRAFKGLGGGTIIGMSNIVVGETRLSNLPGFQAHTTADITPLKSRGYWQGFIGGIWGIASVLGPIFGGLLTERVSWRWVFYINLPTGGIAFACLFFTLKLNPTRKLTFQQFKQTFDFVGLVLIMAAGALLIVGFSEAADYGFHTPRAYAVIVVGALFFIASIAHFMTTKRVAIIPAVRLSFGVLGELDTDSQRMFKNRTTLFFLIASTLHAVAFMPSNYLLPQMFQGVNGSGALRSGIDLLPYACGVSWSTVIAGLINSRLRIIRPVAWVGYALAGIGMILFYIYYRYPIPYALQEGIQIVTAVGVGLSLSTPILILQAAMPLKEMAAATSAWQLTRALGGSIGLAVFTAILNSDMRSRFEQIEGYGTEFEVPTSAAGYRALAALPEGQTKTDVLSAFSDALGLCWIIDAAFFFACLLITLPTRSYSLNRTGGPKPTAEEHHDEKLAEAEDESPDSPTDTRTGQEDRPRGRHAGLATSESGRDASTPSDRTVFDSGRDTPSQAKAP